MSNDPWGSIRKGREEQRIRSEGQWSREEPAILQGITPGKAFRNIFLEAPVKWARLQFPLAEREPDSSRYIHLSVRTVGFSIRKRKRKRRGVYLGKVSYPFLVGGHRVSWPAASFAFFLIIMIIFLFRALL